MDQNTFQFKQFSVAHNKCAMKVNTDGVLLGAWQQVDEAVHILDVGTGSGIIALMMAQKNSRAAIDAIDIDVGAFEQAKENFSNSPWSNRLTAIHTSLQNYFPDKKYDLIISNPPYFIADHPTADHKKNIARHSVALNYETLVMSIARLLPNNGRALVAIPAFNLTVLESLAQAQNLFVTHVTEVTSTSGKEPYLVLIQLQPIAKELLKGALQIQTAEGEFTKEYRELTKEFYLKF